MECRNLISMLNTVSVHMADSLALLALPVNQVLACLSQVHLARILRLRVTQWLVCPVHRDKVIPIKSPKVKLLGVLILATSTIKPLTGEAITVSNSSKQVLTLTHKEVERVQRKRRAHLGLPD
jgi:hypothetical protein